MQNNDATRQIKAFGMTNQMLVEDLQQIESQFSIDLGHVPKVPSVEQTYYPQFDAVVRAEAASMGRHYEAFYCLEKTIRTFVASTIEAAEKKCVVVAVCSSVTGNTNRSQRANSKGTRLSNDAALDERA